MVGEMRLADPQNNSTLLYGFSLSAWMKLSLSSLKDDVLDLGEATTDDSEGILGLWAAALTERKESARDRPEEMQWHVIFAPSFSKPHFTHVWLLAAAPAED